jgi:hypothetical protein
VKHPIALLTLAFVGPLGVSAQSKAGEVFLIVLQRVK